MTAHVYLIHFNRPLAHARHYLGYSCLESVQLRLARHRSGDGARILRACNQKGIGYDIVRVWECNDPFSARALEHKLKSRKKAKELCPICNGKEKENEKEPYQVLFSQSSCATPEEKELVTETIRKT